MNIIRRRGIFAEENMPSVPQTSPRLSLMRLTPEQKLGAHAIPEIATRTTEIETLHSY